MSKRIFRSNRPGYPHPVCSELENSGIRVAVGDCSVTERPPYQTGKTVHVHANTLKHDKDGRTAQGVRDHGSEPLSHSGNVVTRIESHTLGDELAFHQLGLCVSGSARVTNGGSGGMMSTAGLKLPYPRVSQTKFPDETSRRGK